MSTGHTSDAETCNGRVSFARKLWGVNGEQSTDRLCIVCIVCVQFSGCASHVIHSINIYYIDQLQAVHNVTFDSHIVCIRFMLHLCIV